MLKRINIVALVLILLISTTGLTYTFHLCKMVNESDSVMCEMEHVKEQYNCCTDEVDAGQMFTSSQQDCCEFQTIEKRISDEFMSFNSDKNSETSLSFTLVAYFSLANNFNSSSLDFHPNNNSPPGGRSRLFIINSSFLI